VMARVVDLSPESAAALIADDVRAALHEHHR